MRLTFMEIDERVSKLKREASVMLEHGVGEMLRCYKSEHESPYFYDQIGDLYQDYKDDLFEADVITAFRYIIYDYFEHTPDLSHYKDVFNAIKQKDLVSFIAGLKYCDECIAFIKSYVPKKWDEIIICLSRILTETYWSE